jgi:hypothetical protein
MDDGEWLWNCISREVQGVPVADYVRTTRRNAMGVWIPNKPYYDMESSRRARAVLAL